MKLQGRKSENRSASIPLPPAAPSEDRAPQLGAGATIVEELTGVREPWPVFEKLAGLSRPLFLDSAHIDGSLGRFSFITADPFGWLWARRFRTRVYCAGVLSVEGDPFSVLAKCLARYKTAPLPGLPPFQGGAAGLFGYDLCHSIERLPRPRFDEFQAPDIAIGLYDWVISFDHAAGRAWVISTGFPETDARRRRRRASQRLNEIKQRLTNRTKTITSAERSRRSDGPLLCPSYHVGRFPGLLSDFDRAGYMRAAERVIEYLFAGDCFQVNLAQRLLYPLRSSAINLYRRLRERNPVPFGGYFDLGEFVIASASPERFLWCQEGEVETRPIKGTRPRCESPSQDRRMIEELVASAKDRAENVMIVDLLRNDLGRVCRYGSVRVPAVCAVESYPYVHHLVSEVRGRLRHDLGPVDLLRAAFPGGSVTGAPKIRAMEIIAELEPTARGPYCGSLGYIGFDGTMDTSILIRTFTIGRGWVQFPVGGGIVADSIPEREYEETWHKAAGLLHALS
jgi:para-aminobenzoate synthetase component 1